MEHTLIFDQANSNWVDGEFNLIFLRHIENYSNDLLLRRGVVFVNDVYLSLGFDRTQEGQTNGWCSDVHNANFPRQVVFSLYFDREKQEVRIVFDDEGEIYQRLKKESA